MCGSESRADLGVRVAELRSSFFTWSHAVAQRRSHQMKGEMTHHEGQKQEAHQCEILVLQRLPRKNTHSKACPGGASRSLTWMPPTDHVPPGRPVSSVCYAAPPKAVRRQQVKSETHTSRGRVRASSQPARCGGDRCVCGAGREER